MESGPAGQAFDRPSRHGRTAGAAHLSLVTTVPPCSSQPRTAVGGPADAPWVLPCGGYPAVRRTTVHVPQPACDPNPVPRTGQRGHHVLGRQVDRRPLGQRVDPHQRTARCQHPVHLVGEQERVHRTTTSTTPSRTGRTAPSALHPGRDAGGVQPTQHLARRRPPRPPGAPPGRRPRSPSRCPRRPPGPTLTEGAAAGQQSARGRAASSACMRSSHSGARPSNSCGDLGGLAGVQAPGSKATARVTSRIGWSGPPTCGRPGCVGTTCGSARITWPRRPSAG